MRRLLLTASFSVLLVGCVSRPWGMGKRTGEDVRCRLEVVDVFTGERSTVYERACRFEAPNWMPDGSRLLFNMDGRLWTIPVAGGCPKPIDTGSVVRNNNDHVISFDGRLLGISSETETGSAVYVMPLEGGKPKRITEATPSYLHGWTTDSREVLYVAKREGGEGYNIYRKPIVGGAEVALTSVRPGEHVDGCEASPDGHFIYYNGTDRSGLMQIWRMRPDGSQKEQMTADAYNNWFPHLSPDGKWVAFLSYLPDIPRNTHPPHQPVLLRLMSTGDGTPKIMASLFGGQGTINVNAWSPDSRKLAFVSEVTRRQGGK